MKFENLERIGGVALVGATGMVGKEFLAILEERRIRIPRIKMLASERSAGESIDFMGEEHAVEAVNEDSFEGIDVAFFSVPTDVTKKYIPCAVKAGCLVVDDSSVYRMDPNVPLVVPEVNGAVLRSFDDKIIATPNCSTTPLALSLKPLLERYGLDRVVVSTYQSVSGAGRAAYEELSSQAISLLSGAEAEPAVFPHRIAFNCLPQIGKMLENGNSEEEEKVIRELRKILDEPDLRISSTAVRVPTFCGHGISVNAELREPFGSIEEVRELLDQFSGLQVLDKPEASIYPTNVECIGSDLTFVGRIRRDRSVPSGLNFWVITDNLRKGAALNVLQCLETYYRYQGLS